MGFSLLLTVALQIFAPDIGKLRHSETFYTQSAHTASKSHPKEKSSVMLSWILSIMWVLKASDKKSQKILLISKNYENRNMLNVLQA